MNAEKNLQNQFLKKYVDSLRQEIEINRIDVSLWHKDKMIIAMEFKSELNSVSLKKAIAQIILTCKKAKVFVPYYAVAGVEEGEDILYLITHSDAVFTSLSVNWENEVPSNPSDDAVKDICAAAAGNCFRYAGAQIKDVIDNAVKNLSHKIEITEENVIAIFHEWANTVKFSQKEITEDMLINIFLSSLLDGTRYKRRIENLDFDCDTFFSVRKVEGKTELVNERNGVIASIANPAEENTFWNKYKRPPSQAVFLEMYEKRHMFFTETYRKMVGGQYTPMILITKQFEMLDRHLGADWQDRYIVFDPCCGTANLQERMMNKSLCYLSTLDIGDVNVAKSKGFTNICPFDFLKDTTTVPKWFFQGDTLDINEIAKRSNRKILCLINPPYENEKYLQLGQDTIYVWFL
jgi:hypothetical protein